MKTIILASSSPRRKDILEKTGLKFDVESSSFHEEFDNRLDPHELTKTLSHEKAKAIATKYENALIIAADTIIVHQGKILGKPHTAEDAKKVLMTLNGKMHMVVTGFTIIDTSNNTVYSGSEETKVFLKKLTTQEIESYVNTDEPLDKAGAYAIQGLGAVMVKKIEGDYYNVMGLPLSSLIEALKQYGVYVL